MKIKPKPFLIPVFILFCSMGSISTFAQNNFVKTGLPPSAIPVLDDFDGVYYGSVAFADIDGDSDQDVLITGYSSSGGISNLYINNGAGSYNLATGTPFDGVYYGSVAFADIDGDNDQDVLITGNSSSGPIAKLYTNNGSGSFSLVTGTPFDGVDISSIAFADIDGDNDQDVLITGQNSSNQRIAKLYTNDGSGSFSLVTGTPFDGVYQSSIAFADIDGDNDQDVLITGYNSSNQRTAKLYINNGSGSFSLVMGTPFEGVQLGSIAFADIDGDNDLDVLITGSSSSAPGSSKLYRNNGSGNFSLITGTPFDIMNNCSVAFADIDGDNDQDVLIAGWSYSTHQPISKLYTNDGLGNYSLVSGTSFDAGQYGFVAFADIDGDNDQDVLITGRNLINQSIAKLYSNNGSGSFSLVKGTPFEGVYRSSVAFADIDGDNNQDVVITGLNSSKQDVAKLYSNNGSGGFNLVAGTPFDGVETSSVAFADIDGDNDQDMLITGWSLSTQRIIRLYRNDGSGNYTLIPGTPFDAVSYSSIAFADIDGDNDQDVLITGINSSNQRVAKLYTNDGSGNFSLVSGTPFDGVQHSSVAIADIDGDDDQDVLITGINSSNQRVAKLYTNNGAGNYSLVTGTPFDGVWYGSIAFADIDGDNDQDVLITGLNSSNQRVAKLYTNDGSGNFSLVSGTPFDGVQHSSVAFADIDGDNDQDVLITGESYYGEIAKLYTNNGSGTYSLVTGTPFDGVRYGSVAFADIDGDNDQDILITGESSTALTAFLYRNLNCQINYPPISQHPVSACDSYSWSGNTFINSGVYQDTIQNSLGCDSVLILNLTINQSTSSTETLSACDSYSWLGNTFTASGIYYDTIPNAVGCDSLMTLNLTINQSTSSTETLSACDSYSWLGNTFTASGIYYDTIPNAVGCDSLMTLNLTINKSSSSTQTVTECDSYSWMGSTFTASGIYYDTIPNSVGCDSLMTLNLTINQSSSSAQTATACDSFSWLGNTYTASGIYYDTIQNAAGCDSLMTLNLTINNSSSSVQTATACDSYSWLGNSYTFSGTYYDTIPNAAGCDSLMTLNLIINNSSSSANTLTACDSYSWLGNSYTASGIYYDTIQNAAGCDSLMTLNLTINQSTSSADTLTACDSYSWLGNSYTFSGTYYDTIPNAAGCDSLMTLNLTINQSTSSAETLTACDSYSWLGNTFTASGIYYDTIQNAAGCDSLMTLNLTINQSSSSADTITACDSYSWMGSTYTASGIYYDTIPNAAGCDSLMTLNLTINNSTSSAETLTACDSYSWLGSTFTTSGIYYDTIPNAAGCDSLMILNLTINNSTSSAETLTACDSYSWLGSSFTTSGIYYDTIPNAAGCDSLMTLNLTINQSTSSAETLTGCDSYSWLGSTFTTSGIYYDTIPNAAGCDSLMSLNLTINNSTSSADTLTACDSYSWLGSTFTASGIYYDTIPNAAGCDSLMTLNLTINNSTSSADTLTACDSYLWLGSTFTASGIYYDTIPNAAGCDSLMSLNLTINNSTSSADTLTACDSYSWLGSTFTASGIYYDTIPNAAGCDSLMSLNLTINNSTSSADTLTACDSYSWLGSTFTATGIYYDTIPNAAGCDSLMTLNLIINNSTSSADTLTACDSYSWLGSTFTVSGIYFDTIPNAAGCDSLMSLNLTINNSTASADTVVSCNSYNSPSGKYVWTVSGNYVDTIPSSTSCDSIIKIALTIETVDTSTTVNGTTITSNAIGATYQWVDCNNGNAPIVGETDSTFTATSNGSYAVIVSKNSCSIMSACVNIVNVGIEESAIGNNLKLYPNPTSGMLFIDIDIDNLVVENITVFNTLGETVDINISNGNQIDLRNSSRGIYFISIETDKGTVIKKIVKSQ